MRSTNFALRGDPVKATLPDGLELNPARVIWQDSTEEVPAGGEFRRSEFRRAAWICRYDGPAGAWVGVPQVPRGTTLEYLGPDGIPIVWKVDAIEIVEDGHVRAVVIPVAVI